MYCKMEFSYPVPKLSEILGLFSDKWSDFVSRFQCQKNQNGTTKESFLLHFGAKSLKDMCATYQLSLEDTNVILSLVAALEQDFLFQVVLSFFRYLFFNHRRQSGSGIENFYTELKLLSELCSFDNTAADKFIKTHIINSFQEERIRAVFASITNLSARDVVDICAQAEKHGGVPTADTFHACIMDQQQNSFAGGVGVKKDCGWSPFPFQESQADVVVTKGLNLSTVYRTDPSVYMGVSNSRRSSCVEVESAGKDGPYAGGVKFSQLDGFTEFSSFVPNKQASFGVNFNQPVDVEVTSSLLRPTESPVFCASSYQSESIIPSSSVIPPVSIPPQRTGSLKAKGQKGQPKSVAKHKFVSTITTCMKNNDISRCSTTAATTSPTVAVIATTVPSACQPGPDCSSQKPNAADHVAIEVDQDEEELKVEINTEGSEDSSKTANSDSAKAKEDITNEIPSFYCSQQKAMLKTSQIIESTGQSIDIFTCNFCVYNCSEKARMEEHALQEHKSLKCFVCTVCNSKFPSKEQFESHVRIKHMHLEEHKCQICDMVFSNQKKMFLHLQGHAETPTVSCRVCSAMFSTEKLLSDHMANVHPEADRWSCRICNATFSNRKSLAGHVKAHNDTDMEPVRRFMCKVCGIYFMDKKSSEMHKKKFHGNDRRRQFPCDVCSHVCTSNANLVSHRRIHTGEKPYMCEVCGKEFAQLSSLDKHTRIHTGEKPYKCQYCDLSFKASSNRLTHERGHRKERPYICEQCGKTFRNSYELKMHIDTHSAFRPRRFLCHCGAAFDTRRKLRRHEVCHSGVKPYKCDLCGASFTRPENVKGHQKSQACRNRRSKPD